MRKGFGTGKLDNVLREFPELNREWLLTGEGEMFKSDTPSQNMICEEPAPYLPAAKWSTCQTRYAQSDTFPGPPEHRFTECRKTLLFCILVHKPVKIPVVVRIPEPADQAVEGIGLRL